MTDDRAGGEELPGASPVEESAGQIEPEGSPPQTAPLPAGSAPWLLTAILLSLVFLIPTFILLRPASLPSVRAAQAARHGFIQLDNEEGALLFQAKQMSEGESTYHPLTEPPYVAGTYTPLYMAAVAAVDDFKIPSFSKGRVIVWISALGIGALLVLLASSATRNIPVGIATGIIFLATWEVYQWIGYFRVDFPAIFLTFAGLAVVVLGHARLGALAFGSLLMVLALFTKQTTIAAPAACFLALLFHQPRRSLAFAGWMLLWGVPAVIALEVLTGGQFLRHTILYNMNTWHYNDLRIWSRHVWNMHRWFFLGGVVALAAGVAVLGPALLRRAEKAEGHFQVLWGFWHPVAWYAVLAQWNFFGIAKAGSAENYLLEPIAGWALLVSLTSGAMLRHVSNPLATNGRRVLAFVPLIAIVAALSTHALVVSNPDAMLMRFNPAKNPGRADFEASEIIRARMRAAENPLSELAIYHLQSDTEPVIQPFIMSELARQGKWDQGGFVADVAAGKFDVVVVLEDLTKALPGPKYTAEMLEAFRSAYELERILYTPLWQYHILVPKSEPAGQSTDKIAGL